MSGQNFISIYLAVEIFEPLTDSTILRVTSMALK